jgi:hypothetical protein
MFRVTSYSDIAGQVSASSANADRITVGIVYLPTGGLKAIRKQIPPSFPKWRDATDAHLEYMVTLILRESLSVSAGSIDKTTSEWWAFWVDASATHNKVASIGCGSIGFLKAATLIKFTLFGDASAAALGHAIYTGRIPRGLSRKRTIEIEETVVLDNEIQGDDNREALVGIWRAINGHQPLANSLGVTRTAKTLQLTSEQAEPLLLLADYVAGAVQAVRSQANVLQRSQVTPEAVAAGLRRLQHSGRLTDFSDTVRLKYFDIYPDFEHFSKRGAA